MNYRHLGLMVDCSRNAVMNIRTVYRLIDVMARLGYDTLELYTEDTYEVENEPYFGYLRGRYSAEELRAIDEYAKGKGVELIPCIQTLAHFTAPSRLPAFSKLWDTADILLVGEERTYEFIENLFKTVRSCFSSKNINIGMDEAHLVGLGNYLHKHGYTNRFDILTEHLERVARIAEKYGFTAHMWSDMYVRLVNGGDYYGKDIVIPDEVARRMPKNVEPCYWDYYHEEQSDYDAMFRSHQAFGRNTWFAGCLWGWCGFAPYNVRTQRHMKAAMKSVIANSVQDVLFTAWGDNGAECSLFSLLPSLYAVRQYADGIFDERVIAAGFEQEFGISFERYMLADLPNFTPQNQTGNPLENPAKALLYADCFLGVLDENLAQCGRIPYGEYAEKLARVEGEAGEYGYVFRTLSKLCAALAVKAELGIRTRNAYRTGKDGLKGVLPDYATAIARIEEFYEAFAAQWLKDNKPFGLEIHQVRIGGVLFRLRNAKARIEAYLNGEIDKIEELEEEILSYSDEGLWCGTYDNMISTSLL